MESVDKLRDANVLLVWEGGTIRANELADEIEREIAERFVELPVDADGVPIHVGDMLEYVYKDIRFVRKVVAVSSDMFAWEGVGSDGDSGLRGVARFHRHVKPRTLEDVLTEMLDRNRDGIGLREFNRDFAAFVGHYADEIRELMGVE